MVAPYVQDIVRARAVLAGKSVDEPQAGVVASRKPPPCDHVHAVGALDFPTRGRLSPFLCAVPPTLPSNPEGVGAFPGAGPYDISQYVRGRSCVVLERNPFYRGLRPHHVDRFVVDFTAPLTAQEGRFAGSS